MKYLMMVRFLLMKAAFRWNLCDFSRQCYRILRDRLPLLRSSFVARKNGNFRARGDDRFVNSTATGTVAGSHVPNRRPTPRIFPTLAHRLLIDRCGTQSSSPAGRRVLPGLKKRGYRMKLRHLLVAATLALTTPTARAQGFSDTSMGVRDGPWISNPGGGRDREMSTRSLQMSHISTSGTTAPISSTLTFYSLTPTNPRTTRRVVPPSSTPSIEASSARTRFSA